MAINDNYETITCRICGEQCKRIYGMHLKFKHNNMTTEQYKNMFPDAPITSLADKLKTTKNSGKHMKTEKYRKLFSEKAKGENNPNHRSKTTEKERKSRSPFSKQFIKYKDIDNKEEHISKFVKEAIKDRISDTTIQYYINKGHDEETAKKMLHDRQSTFKLEKCIQKYGQEEGNKIWLERQFKWQKSLIDNGNIKCGYSRISQELFQELLKYYYIDDIANVYYAVKNHEHYISKKGVGFFSYDFTDISKKKIIEYNGDQYHANPKLYKADDFPHPYYKENGPTALDIWKKDNIKLNLAKEYGFDILVVWDSEYKKNKNETIKKCLNFLQIY